MIPDQPFTWYALFKDFQTALAALFGFTGVCLTLLFNAWLANRTRTEHITHDRRTTRLTLSSELSVIQKSLQDWKEVLDDLRNEGKAALPRAFDAEGASRGYRAALPKIGLLTEQEIQQTVLAYSQYEVLSKMSYDMQEQFDPKKPNEGVWAFQAYHLGLTNTLSAVDEALESITEAHVIEKAKDKL